MHNLFFKNQEHETSFTRQGFVVLPLLDEEEIEALKSLYGKNYKQQHSGLQPLLRIGNASQNLLVHEQIGEIVKSALDKFFHPYQFNANHFIVKGANDSNEFKMHQDWNVTEESNFPAAHIWCAIQPVDINNGGLMLLPGSHRLLRNYRSGSLKIPFINNENEIAHKTVTPKLKAGEAIIYHQAVFHGSHPNNSNTNRLVTLISIRPVNAPMLYYQKAENNNELDVYEINPQILFEQVLCLEKGDAPQGANIIQTIAGNAIPNNQITSNIVASLLKS